MLRLIVTLLISTGGFTVNAWANTDDGESPAYIVNRLLDPDTGEYEILRLHIENVPADSTGPEVVQAAIDAGHFTVLSRGKAPTETRNEEDIPNGDVNPSFFVAGAAAGWGWGGVGWGAGWGAGWGGWGAGWGAVWGTGWGAGWGGSWNSGWNCQPVFWGINSCASCWRRW